MFVVEQKIDQMYAAFTGQPLEKVQQYTERDRFFSTSEVVFSNWMYLNSLVQSLWRMMIFSLFQALEFGLIDGVLETLY